MAKRRYLTKSRFKLATECPTKLFYTGKSEYANQNLDDSFLLALADGGFQVGELAKCYFPGGHDIKTLDYDEALADTNAAICGALLGAVCGREAIPAQWLDCLQNCRPEAGHPQVRHPRPECFWPVDVLELAEGLVKT